MSGTGAAPADPDFRRSTDLAKEMAAVAARMRAAMSVQVRIPVFENRKPGFHHHRHGRWIGLFKLSEEAGELLTAAAMVVEFGAGKFSPQSDIVGLARTLYGSLQSECADTLAACEHAIACNDLQRGRILARAARAVAGTEIPRNFPALIRLIEQCGLTIQLLGKIAAFPFGTEHPDGAGNLPGRFEVRLADLLAAIDDVHRALRFDEDLVAERFAEKLGKFRTWFPAGARP